MSKPIRLRAVFTKKRRGLSRVLLFFTLVFSNGLQTGETPYAVAWLLFTIIIHCAANRFFHDANILTCCRCNVKFLLWVGSGTASDSRRRPRCACHWYFKRWARSRCWRHIRPYHNRQIISINRRYSGC